MLTSTGAKLLDFGLAKSASALVDMAMTATKVEPPVTEQETIVGTFQYMSPEQVEGRELDGRSDIFSLGAVLLRDGNRPTRLRRQEPVERRLCHP